jgi:hypothetical protein
MKFSLNFIIVIACTFIIATHLNAETSKAVKPKLSKAEIIEKFRQARLKNRVETGGLIYGKAEGKMVEIVNRQNIVSQELLDAIALEIKFHTLLPISFVNAKSSKAGIVVELVDSDNEPTILSAPEGAWAKLNIANLKKDNPDAVKLKNRTSKQLWRTIASAMGIGVSSYQPCLMRNIATLKDLDRCKLERPGPATLNTISESANFFGITPLKVGSYLKACQEGWAPAPTNDIQKAIWDKVHATPKNPMKIEFDPKKGR